MPTDGEGQAAQSYRTLARVAPQPEDSWYARCIILKAQILVDTQNFRDALALLTPFIEQYPKGEATQVAYLLSAYCDKGLGDRRRQRCPWTPATSLIPPATRPS